jgi:hypothetical protein
MNSTKAKPATTNEVATVPKNVTHSQANDALNEIFLTGESKLGLTEQQCLEILESTPSEALQEQTSEYFDFSKKGEYNLVFEGMDKTTFEKNGVKKEVEIVKLKNKNNQRFIAGGAVLVNTCKRLTQIPSFIRVITTGEKISGTGGDYYEMRVLTFGN